MSVQEIKEKEERNQPRRRNRVAYVPNSRRKSSASRSDANDSSSSNVQKTEEKQKRNKRRANDSVSTSLKSGHQQPKRKKGSGSSTEEKSSPRKPSTSERTEGESEITDKQRAVTMKRVYKRRNQAEAAPERIRDMTVTKKTYAKWKPLSLSTKKYTKRVLESAILSVLNSVGKESKKNSLQVHLKQLSERIVKRLDSIKGPTHKGDYSKMEAESRELEDTVISCHGQIGALEIELEEQTRLFEEDENMFNRYTSQEQELQQQKQLHPLLQAEPANTLNLPSLSNETCSMATVCEIPASLEDTGRRLAQSLAKITDQAEQLGFTNWLETVNDRTNALVDSKQT